MAGFSSSSSSDEMTSESTSANGPAPMNVYLYAGDQIIENVTMGYFYYQDSLGNTSHVTDAVGNLLERYTYDAFGKPSFFNSTSQPLNSSTYGIRHLFQGQLWTQETGLNDYRNRVELPVMGVFLQPDPLGFKGDAANIYRFCNNNAVNRTDPTGLVNTNAGTTLEERMRLFYGSGDTGGGLYDLNVANSRTVNLGMVDQYPNGDTRGNAKDVTINQLQKQLVANNDETTQGVPTEEGLVVAAGGTGVKKPRGGRASGAFGYTGRQEQINLRKDADRLIHAHTLEGKRYALPTPDDDDTVQHSRGRPMYFTSRYLARHGASPDGHPGNYLIYHFTGSRSWDQPRPEYHFDPRLSLPPLLGY